MHLRRMVITSVTLRLFFLLQLSSALAVNVFGGSGASAVILPEQVLQLVQQPSGGQQS